MGTQAAYRYVTRDEAGMYLGAYTLEEAQAVWPAAKRLGLIIRVPGKVPARNLANILNERRDKPDAASSSMLRRSASKAISGSLSALSQGLDPHRNPSSPPLKDVINRVETPVCTIPLSIVERLFGSGWFFVDDSTIQLVTTFSESSLKRLANDAQRRYKEVFPAPRAVKGATPNATDGDASTMAGMADVPHPQQSVLEQGDITGSTITDTTDETHGQIPHYPLLAMAEPQEPADRLYVCRDAMGLYLGVHKREWARSHQDGAHVDGPVIVLPEAVPTRKAASLAGKSGKKTLQPFDRDFQEVIKRSESFMSRIPRLSSEAFWSRQDFRLVEVRSLTSSSLGSLTPSLLRELFGNGWFLVSPDEAQLMVPVDNDSIGRIRTLEAEARAIIDAKAAEAKKAWEDTLRATTDDEQRSTDDSHAHRNQSEESRESTIPPFMRLMMSLGIGEAHARTIYGQVMLVVQHGYRSQLIGTLREAFPVDPVALPGGRELDAYRIAGALARQYGQSLTHEERDYVLLEIDKAMSEGERRAEEERHEQEKQLERAERHKHAVIDWVESVELDPNADAVSKELAAVFELRQGVVLVMQDGDLYRSVLNTDLDRESYTSIDQFLPFTHFIVRVPKIEGVYGFGVVRGSRGSGVDLIAIPDGRSEGGDVDALLPFFWRVLFFICANRNSAGGGTEYYDQARSRARSASVARAQSDRKTSRRKRVSENAVVLGKTFDIGMRVVFLSEGPGFRNASSSSLDIRPHAVAGTTYVNSNGTEVVRRPYWNHGAGKKRNALPPEIVERNIRYRSDSRE